MLTNYSLTHSLTYSLMPSAKHNSTMDVATGLIFSLFDIASCLFANCRTYNACIMELPCINI